MTDQSPEFARLSERVSHMQATMNELRDSVAKLVESNARVVVVENDLTHMQSTIERCFHAIDKLASVTQSNGRIMAKHSFAIRSAAAIIAASAGLVGWGWNTIDSIHRNSTSLDTRVTFMERANHVQQANR